VAVLILAAIALAVLEFADPDRPWQGALYMTAGALAVTTPHYQWYSLLLVMLVALDGRPEWLAFAAGGYYASDASLGRYTPPWRLADAIAYGVPLMVVAAGWLIRRELARRELARRELARRELARRELDRRELARRELDRRAGVAGLPPLADAPAGSTPAETVPAETVAAEFMGAGFIPAGSAADAGREVPV
jgi:hypothetical protein